MNKIKKASVNVAFLAIFGALMLVAQLAFSFSPQVEFVTTIVAFCTLFFGWQAVFSTLVFCFLRLLIYGIDMYSLTYFIIYLIFVCLLLPIRLFFVIKRYSAKCIIICSAFLCGLWGALTGLFFLPSQMLFISKTGIEISIWKWWWVGFLSTDIWHCISNIILSSLIILPSLNVLNSIKQKF